jgi:hypothetical protein
MIKIKYDLVCTIFDGQSALRIRASHSSLYIYECRCYGGVYPK